MEMFNRINLSKKYVLVWEKGIYFNKSSLFCLSLIFCILCTTTQAYAYEKDYKEQFINKELTKSVIKDTELSINNLLIDDFLVKKLSTYDIFVVNDDICSIPKYSNNKKDAQALIDYADNRIIIHKNPNNVSMKQSLIHELGHAIDTWGNNIVYKGNYIGKYSSTDEFQNIFKTESSSLKNYANDSRFETDVQEFFAESFSLYILSPYIVKSKAPMLCKYIEANLPLKLVSGWQLNKKNIWSYSENNQYKTGWFKDVDGRWYYFSKAGEMMKNITVDGYNLNSEGVMDPDKNKPSLSPVKFLSGWKHAESGTWSYVENNEYKTGWFKDVDGRWYYFSKAGEMMKDVKIDEYYLALDGERVKLTV